MKIAMFYHSLRSDWNHGNAHFLRGVVKEMIRRGHEVMVYEPANGWSFRNLVHDHGERKANEFSKYYPSLSSSFYPSEDPSSVRALVKDAHLVIVHEWTGPEIVAAIGEAKSQYGFTLLFHDTHHRVVSNPSEMERFDFSPFDGALVFGEVIRQMYLKKKWIPNVWTWYEAADVELFKPQKDRQKKGDLVWIGNWGDDEREEELMEFLIRPVAKLKLKARVYGVRYPEHALKALRKAGIEYKGWLPNYKVPGVFANYKLTVHVPRRPYSRLLPGIPTIRPFEAMACGIPLLSAPWEDSEKLFRKDTDYLQVADGQEMQDQIDQVLNNPFLHNSLSRRGLERIMEQHTCSHRVGQLENILAEIAVPTEKN